MRIGFGYDVHRLVEKGKLILGGVEIPYDKGLLGHSDADVVIHSLIDALLGALAMGDIGQLFPDSDDRFKGIDSRILLRKAYGQVKGHGFKIGNADITICLQEPKIASYLPVMREHIASDLETDVANISVKATTEEGLGISGSKEGVVSYTIIILIKN